MSDTNKKAKFTKWLEYLEQESWQLELIISGILLVVLDAGQESVTQWSKEILVHQGPRTTGFLVLFPMLFLSSFAIAKTNLVFHIFLRGLWIGCIGLRYVSKEIDIDSLNYSSKFSNYLKKNNKGFDHYLEELEKICSIIFSFTFLVIFELGAIFLFIAFIFLNLIFLDNFEWKIFRIISLIWIWGLVIALIFHLLDFITLGFFKKKKILSKIYYPFYRLFDFFSLSYLFRPLYYNFIDNDYGRKYLKFVIPYFFILLIVQGGVNIGSYKFLPEKHDSKNWISERCYEDERIKTGNEPLVSIAIIPSIKIKENILPVFLPYIDTRQTERVLENICPDVEGIERNVFRIYILSEIMAGVRASWAGKNSTNNSESLLDCHAQVYTIKIDTIEYNAPEFYFYEHPEFKSKGIITYLNIKDVAIGDHSLFISKKINYRDSAFIEKEINVPFIKY